MQLNLNKIKLQIIAKMSRLRERKAQVNYSDVKRQQKSKKAINATNEKLIQIGLMDDKEDEIEKDEFFLHLDNSQNDDAKNDVAKDDDDVKEVDGAKEDDDDDDDAKEDEDDDAKEDEDDDDAKEDEDDDDAKEDEEDDDSKEGEDDDVDEEEALNEGVKATTTSNSSKIN
jgi:hypothetical protein